MRIAVNTRLLLSGKMDGIGWFTFHTLKILTQKHKEHQFYFLFDRKYNEKFIFGQNITPLVISPPTRHPFLWYYWFEKQVPKILKKINADFFLSPDGYLSLKTNVLSLPVIHDINFAHKPDDLPFFIRKYYNKFFPEFAKNAKRIATVSEFSKKDISETYKIALEKIDVVYNGSNPIYQPIDEPEKDKIKEQFSEGKDYFIFIGSLHPRKNIPRLFQAFDSFKKETSSDFKLVIVGGMMFKNEELKAIHSKMEFKDDVIFTGRLSPVDLSKVLATAYCLTFVPYFEGFGIPIIEAMNCDVPVITSNTTSMPEVAGDAALIINPFSIEEIKDAMLKISSNKELRKDLIEKSKNQRLMFSWEKTADKLWESIEKCLI